MLASVLPAFAGEAPPGWCRAGLKDTEQVICAKPELWKLDAELNSRYAALKDTLTVAEARQLAADETDWLAGRDGCLIDFDCIVNAYHQRLDDLDRQSGAAGSGL